jgi:glycosyltransferase involved in cell wall biosynthesis
MKVLMFGWEFPPHISGGLGTACYGLTKGLAGFKDLEVSFVVPKAWGDEDDLNVNLIGAGRVPVIQSNIQFADTDSKVDYYELKSELIPYLGTNEFFELKSKISSGERRLIEITEEGKFIFGGDYGPNLFQEIRNYALVAETIAREMEFDVIHVHDWMTFSAGMAVKRISGKPLVVHVHSTEFDRSGSQVNPAICTIEKEGLEAADKIIAVSYFTRNIILEKYHIAPEKVKTVYNAVEPLSSELKPIQKNAGEKKIVSFLGRITMQKGPEYFINAASLVLQKMENVHFVMAGKGDLLNAMIKRAAELNISDSIDFPGFLKDNEVTELFRKSDVFVMPSVSEPFGIVALEAMQANVPVIVSKQSGASEVLKNVLKVDYWDVHEMANAIYAILTDESFSNNLIVNGKEEVDQLRWTNSASEVRAIYLQLIDEPIQKVDLS